MTGTQDAALDAEPVDFEGGAILCRMGDEVLEEALAPGGRLHERWCALVEVAVRAADR
ncbi:hypothetical protein [Kineococcus sp. SYSU DK018]|uniref:hypothetical protein n=1 Tax=Kineococcus sp. SYSU DK018 TaxID=3383139 RepID=UPI003D7C52E5